MIYYYLLYEISTMGSFTYVGVSYYLCRKYIRIMESFNLEYSC